MPQEVCGLQELLQALSEINVKASSRFLTPGVGSIADGCDG